jgi:hypothetical protein
MWTWIGPLLVTGAASIGGVIRLALKLRFYRHVYDTGGADDLERAARAVNTSQGTLLPSSTASAPAARPHGRRRRSRTATRLQSSRCRCPPDSGSG